MKRKFVVLVIVSILIIFSTSIFAETIDVKDYIKGKLPLIFNIYLSSLGELDEYEKEFIDLLQNLPEEEQKNYAKEVYDNGFSKDILERIKTKDIITKPETEIEEKDVEETPSINTGKWIYDKGINPLNDKVVIIFKLECENNDHNNKVFLILKKEGKKTIIYLDWGVEVKTLYERMVVVWTRFGDKKATKSFNWSDSIVTFGRIVSESIFGEKPVVSQYTFYDGRKTEFIRKLIDCDRFIAEIRAIDRMKLTAVFDVRGLKNIVEEFNDTLNWLH